MQQVLQYLLDLPTWVADLLVILALVLIFFLGFKIDSFLNLLKTKKIKKNFTKDNETAQKSLKKLWDDEKLEWEKKVNDLEEEKTILEKKLEEYRRQISGFKSLSIFSRKKKEFFYNLLVENETLEQLLEEQNRKINSLEKNKSKEKLLVVKEKQKILENVLSDSKIKDYIQEKIKSFPSSLINKKK